MSVSKSSDSASLGTCMSQTDSSDSTVTEVSLSEDYFIQNNENVKVLVAMMIGMKYNEHTLINDSSLKTFNVQKSSDIKPSNTQLEKEVIRRKTLLGDTTKTKPNQKREIYLEWL